MARNKNTPQENFMRRIRNPYSAVRTIIDYFVYHGIIGRHRGQTKKQFMPKVSWGINSDKPMSDALFHLSVLQINRFFEPIKIVSERVNGPQCVYYIPRSPEQDAFDEKIDSAVALKQEIKEKVDKYIADNSKRPNVELFEEVTT